MKLPSLVLYCMLGLPLICHGQQTLIFAQIINTPDQVIGAEILRVAYGYLSIPIEILPISGKRALIESSEGRLDGEVHRIINIAHEYPTLLRVPTSINYIEPTVFSNGKNITIKDCSSLTGYKIGRVRGVKHAEICTKNMKKITIYNNSRILIDNLILNRIDFIITAKVNGLMHLKKIGNQSVLALSPSLSHLPVYHYLHEQHIHLVQKLDAIFRKMKSSGELESIRERIIAKMLAQIQKE